MKVQEGSLILNSRLQERKSNVNVLQSTEIHKVGFTNGRIYGGKNADDGEFPFQISVWYTYIINFEHVCGGSIIAPNKVLSAAHCITDVPGSGTYNLKAGLTNFDRKQFEQTIQSASNLIHPDYKGGVNPNDIAIVSNRFLRTFCS